MKAWVEDIRVLGWKTISLISMAFWQAAGGGGAKLKSLGYEEQCRGVKGRKHKKETRGNGWNWENKQWRHELLSAKNRASYRHPQRRKP